MPRPCRTRRTGERSGGLRARDACLVLSDAVGGERCGGLVVREACVVLVGGEAS